MDRLVSNLNTIISENKASAAQQAAIMSGQDKLDRLRHSMIDAKNKVHNGPGELKNAEKAYYTALKGETGYRLWKEENAAKDQSELESFASNLNRQLLSQISRGLFTAQLGEGLEAGTYNFGSLALEIYDSNEGLVINILDTNTGEQTQIIVPNQ